MVATLAGSAGSLSELDQYIERVRGDWQNVGAAVAVVRGDEVVYARGFGAREITRTSPVTADTLFEIGSTTKAFTTAALGMLVDDGKLTWDDRIVDWLPDFRLRDEWVSRQLTVRDAVSHRSGVADNYYPYLTIMDTAQVVGHLRHLSADGRFRDSFRYNNHLYAVAGKVIEAASGSTWHEFMRQRVLTPLKMLGSGTSAHQFWDERFIAPTFYGTSRERGSIDKARDDNVAMPHGFSTNGLVQAMPWLSFDSAAPAGSIVSSVADMANWLRLHLNEGRFEGQQLLQPQTLRHLHAAQNLRVDNDVSPLRHVRGAMGWLRSRYEGHVHVAHGGGVLGFPAYVALLPERRIGVVVLSNGPVAAGDDYKFHRAIAFWAFDRLLGAATRDWGRQFQEQLRELKDRARKTAEELQRARARNTTPSLPLENYAGEYEDRAVPSGRVRLTVEEGRLTLRFAGDGAFRGYLEHWENDRFRLHSDCPGHNVIEFGFADFAIEGGAVTSLCAGSAYFKFTLQRLT